MSDPTPTLQQVFVTEDEKVAEERFSEVEAKPKVDSLKQKVSELAKGVRWKATRSEIVKKVADLLDIAIPDILIGAWKKCETLQEYADKEKHPPNETALVPLAEHKIRSTHKPHIEILVNETPIGKIDFDIDVSLALSGMVLKIQAGKIMEIQTGSCKAGGTIKCEGTTLAQTQLKPIQLPGTIHLGTGIPI
jgi:hypothetical protein